MRLTPDIVTGELPLFVMVRPSTAAGNAADQTNVTLAGSKLRLPVLPAPGVLPVRGMFSGSPGALPEREITAVGNPGCVGVNVTLT